MKYQISPQFPIHPKWLREFESGIFEVVDSQLLLGDKVFRFSDTPLVNGTKVMVSYNRNFYCEPLEDIEQRNESVRLKWEEKAKLESQRQLDTKAEAELFWANYKIPFEFTLGIKEVLSGLQMNSGCNGQKRNTVTHVVLTQDIKVGRIIRGKGDFLCSNSKSRWGANWSNTLGDGHWDWANGEKYLPKITCASCLKKLEKYLLT